MRKHGPLICLVLLFILPVLGAAGTLLYKQYHALPTLQHGNFVQPPQVLSLTDRQIIAGNSPQDKWLIVHLNKNIDPDTQNKLQQLHVALGAARDRVTVITANALDNNFPAESILILNPQQMCILQYQDLNNYSGLLKDMRRLLKYSHV